MPPLIAVGFFVAGIVSFLVCFGFVLVDIYQGLRITRYETRLMDEFMERMSP